MTTPLTNKAYSELIQEDIDWLLENSPRSLERDHIIQIIKEHEKDITSK